MKNTGYTNWHKLVTPPDDVAFTIKGQGLLKKLATENQAWQTTRSTKLSVAHIYSKLYIDKSPFLNTSTCQYSIIVIAYLLAKGSDD